MKGRLIVYRYCIPLAIILFILCGVLIAQIADSVKVTSIQETSVIEIHGGNHAKIIRFSTGGRDYAYLIEVKDFNFVWYGSMIKYIFEILLALASGVLGFYVAYKKVFKKKRGK